MELFYFSNPSPFTVDAQKELARIDPKYRNESGFVYSVIKIGFGSFLNVKTPDGHYINYFESRVTRPVLSNDDYIVFIPKSVVNQEVLSLVLYGSGEWLIAKAHLKSNGTKPTLEIVQTHPEASSEVLSAKSDLALNFEEVKSKTNLAENMAKINEEFSAHADCPEQMHLSQH